MYHRLTLFLFSLFLFAEILADPLKAEELPPYEELSSFWIEYFQSIDDCVRENFWGNLRPLICRSLDWRSPAKRRLFLVLGLRAQSRITIFWPRVRGVGMCRRDTAKKSSAYKPSRRTCRNWKANSASTPSSGLTSTLFGQHCPYRQSIRSEQGVNHGVANLCGFRGQK